MNATAKVTEAQAARQAWLGLLARAELTELEGFWSTIEPKPLFKELRAPEIGLVMARGRMGGDGQPFNFGEVTVTRCSVQLDNGALGHGYTMGRDRAKARFIALLDGMLQDQARAPSIHEGLLQPLEARLAQERNASAEKAAATKVDFFTMARER
ncbi:MAG: phosphonate C-P lyase system protein PhnG [Pseudomonadota bacterium]